MCVHMNFLNQVKRLLFQHCLLRNQFIVLVDAQRVVTLVHAVSFCIAKQCLCFSLVSKYIICICISIAFKLECLKEEIATENSIYLFKWGNFS